jgi:riboflavin synthase
MHATIRRYEGVDVTRMNEVTSKVKETLVPQIRELPGFAAYYLIEAGNGVVSSLGLFETSEQADESTKVVAKWITDENLSTAIPNAPKITSGEVIVQSDRVLAVA